MKHLILVLFISVFMQIGLFAQSKAISDPVYFGMMLIDQPSADQMEKICDYYDLREQPEIDGYRVFQHSDGTELRFLTDMIGSKYQPVVKVYTNKSGKEIDQILNDASYHKEKGVYFKGTKFEMRRTKCTVNGTGRKTLTFEKEYNTL